MSDGHALMATRPRLPDRPQLRADLVVQDQCWRGMPVTIVKDPDSQRYFRMDARGYAIARELCGEQTLGELLPRLQRDYELKVSYEQLEGFVQQLNECGFLTASASASQARRQRHWYDRILQIELALTSERLSPDWLRSILRLLLNRFTVSLTLLITLVAYGFLISQAGTIADQIRQLQWSEIFIALYLATAVLTALHELGHAMACTRLGGTVHRFGFVLYYF